MSKRPERLRIKLACGHFRSIKGGVRPGQYLKVFCDSCDTLLPVIEIVGSDKWRLDQEFRVSYVQQKQVTA